MCYNACDKWKPIVSSQGYNHASVKDFELFTTFCYLLSGGNGWCREAIKGGFLHEIQLQKLFINFATWR